jgi:hypothetical protein
MVPGLPRAVGCGVVAEVVNGVEDFQGRTLKWRRPRSIMRRIRFDLAIVPAVRFRGCLTFALF